MTMLSIEECRRILNNPDLTDEQVVEIRDTLYSFAHLFIDQYVREHSDAKKEPPKKPPTPPEDLEWLPL